MQQETILSLISFDFKKWSVYLDYFPLNPLYMELKTLKKAELIAKATELASTIEDQQEQLALQTDRYIMEANKNLSIECKIQKIAAAISRRFDADGIDDIKLPSKITWASILFSLGSITKLIKEIISIIKDGCNPTTPISNDNTESTLSEGSNA